METPSTFGHVSSLNIYDPTGVPGGAGLDATKRLILERIDQLAPFRRRLVEVPLGLDLPYWIEDPDFDIDFHVRHHAVPPPGTPEQLAEVVSRIVARPLDRSRPLWELYVIEGVDDGRLIAQLTKVHHATIDGAAGRIDAGRDPRHRSRLPSRRRTRAPGCPTGCPPTKSCCGITMREYVRRPEKMVRLTVRAIRELAAATQSGGLRALADLVAQPMPGPVGNLMRTDCARSTAPTSTARPRCRPPRRRARRGTGRSHRTAGSPTPRCSLDDAKTIRRRFGCTFNDVVMALCRARCGVTSQQARLPARREPDRDGAGQRAQRQRGRHLPEPGVGAARRPGHQRGRSGEATAPACSRA